MYFDKELVYTETSASTAAVEKADGPAAPASPTLVSKTYNSVTLEANAAHEFRADGGAWQDSNVFTGLSPETEYTFTARFKETATHKASAVSDGLSVTTDASPAEPDTTPPVVADGTIDTSDLTETGVTLSWHKATDDVSTQEALQYLIYRSDSDNIDTVENIETNGTAEGTYAADIDTKEITGLTGGATYYFNVIVKDEAGNKTAYTMKEVTTSETAAMTAGPGQVTASDSFDEIFTLTIVNDTVTESVYASDITLGGVFAGLSLGDVTRSGDITVTAAVYGNLADTGTGIIALHENALTYSNSPLQAEVTVTAPGGETSDNADLSDLVISQGTLTPGFDPAETAYSASVSSSVNSIDITPTAADSKTTVTVNGSGVAGGTLSFGDAIVIIPPGVLPDDTTFTISKLTSPEADQLVPQGLRLQLAGDIYEITTTGSRDFGDNSITIKIAYEPDGIAPGEVPVINYFDEEAGEWVALETALEQGENGKWYAVVEVNHLTKFTVFSTPVSEPLKTLKVIKLTVGMKDVNVDGAPYTLDAPPFIKPELSRTLVPLRFVSEMLGASLSWLAETRQVVIRDGGMEIVLTIGSEQVLVNGTPTVLDAPAELVVPPGRTFVPLRFVSETLGTRVQWDATTQGITITR